MKLVAHYKKQANRSGDRTDLPYRSSTESWCIFVHGGSRAVYRVHFPADLVTEKFNNPLKFLIYCQSLYVAGPLAVH